MRATAGPAIECRSSRRLDSFALPCYVGGLKPRMGDETMCKVCEGDAAGRRDFLKFGAGALAAVTLAGAMRPARAAEGAPTPLSPDEALAALKSGNERYVSHPE